MEIEISAKQKAAVRRAGKNGDYHLLMGAGMSRDSLAKSGEYLPLAVALTDLLATEFNVPKESGDSLWRIYARAVDTAGEAPVYAWMKEIFWGVTPPEWMRIYARAPWSMVWTLNVDDSFERSYEEVRSEVSRTLSIINWDDEFRRSNELAVVHLHGCADTVRPRRLIFSLSEYADSAVVQAAWPLNFRDIYGVSPFVIIGATTFDEPDVEPVVARRKPTHEAPSFYVRPHISAATEHDLRSWNLIPVRMTAEEFSVVWPELIGSDLLKSPSRKEEVYFRLGRQFRHLHMPDKADMASGHDFIGGDEPFWSDIRQELHADLGWIEQASTSCQRLGEQIRHNSALIYTGKRLTGRSTGLLAIGYSLRKLSWRVYLFVGDERIDIDVILEFASSGREIALLFDSVADIVDDIRELLRRAREADLKIVCVAVDEAGKEASIIGRIDREFLFNQRVGRIKSRLDKSDAARLVDKLNGIGRLGALEPLRDQGRLAHFRNKELFISMEQLEHAAGFGQRVGELVHDLADQKGSGIELLFLSSFASRLNRKFYVPDAARMVGLESDQVVRMILNDNFVSSVLKTDGQWIKTRHRWLALEHSVSALGEGRSLTVLGNAMHRVAPRIGRLSQRERNATSLLVGSYMGYKWLSSVFPTADLDQWYESLSGIYGSWSARYWEQRSIMCRTEGRARPELLAKSESFAERAITIVRDAYSLTTLGTVLMTRAARSDEVDVGQYYDRALHAFEAAGELDPSNLVTWLAYLRFASEIPEERHERGRALNREFLESLEADYIRIDGQMRAVSTASEDVRADLDRLKRRFDRACSTFKNRSS